MLYISYLVLDAFHLIYKRGRVRSSASLPTLYDLGMKFMGKSRYSCWSANLDLRNHSMRQRITLRGSVNPLVRPSIGPPVTRSSIRTRKNGCFDFWRGGDVKGGKRGGESRGGAGGGDKGGGTHLTFGVIKLVFFIVWMSVVGYSKTNGAQMHVTCALLSLSMNLQRVKNRPLRQNPSFRQCGFGMPKVRKSSPGKRTLTTTDGSYHQYLD